MHLVVTRLMACWGARCCLRARADILFTQLAGVLVVCKLSQIFVLGPLAMIKCSICSRDTRIYCTVEVQICDRFF